MRLYRHLRGGLLSVGSERVSLLYQRLRASFAPEQAPKIHRRGVQWCHKSAIGVLLLIWGCGDAITAPPPPPPPTTPVYVLASGYASPDAAARSVELWGGTLDMGGAPITGAITLKSSPMLVNQVRGVRITNCFGGWTGGLSMSPGVSSYFLTLSDCLILSPVELSGMFNSTIENVWMPAGGLTLTGASFYNTIRNLYAGGNCLTFTAAAGPSLGANHNQVIGGRCQGTITIGANVQDIDITGMAFEGCTGTCLKIAGTRIHIGFNRWECASPIGIEIEPGSDGVIDPQVWSSCGVRIAFAPGADPLNWQIAAQPTQNVVTP